MLWTEFLFLRRSPRIVFAMQEAPNLRSRKKVNTRGLILKSTRALFRENGFSQTKLEDIARAAGFHKQTVLRYFGSNKEIALAFRQIALTRFRAGLLNPERSVGVIE